MNILNGKRIFVAGGTGDVGVGIVAALLDQGASVLVPSRSPEKGQRLRDSVRGDGLQIIPGDVGTVHGATDVAAQIDRPLAGVVASLGGWWQGPVLSLVSADDWDAIIAGNLTSHFAVARAFVPLLQANGGSYVQILGAAAEYPIAGSSLVSITAAGVAMMGRLLAAEHADLAIHFRQVMIASIVATRARQVTDPSWVTARDVGEVVSAILAGPADAPAVTRMEPRAVQ
jgi:3-oxoacyl-[acyl-carrier protein] reductase